MSVKNLGMAPGSAKFTNVPPLGLTRRANALQQPGGERGWAQVELTDALPLQRYNPHNLINAIKPNILIPPPRQLSWECAALLSKMSRVRTSARPTLRVFKLLRRKFCLCDDICKWLDFLVFSNKVEKLQVPSQSTSLIQFLWEEKEPKPLFKKSRGCRPRC